MNNEEKIKDLQAKIDFWEQKNFKCYDSVTKAEYEAKINKARAELTQLKAKQIPESTIVQRCDDPVIGEKGPLGASRSSLDSRGTIIDNTGKGCNIMI
jgi:hypothetical protein